MNRLVSGPGVFLLVVPWAGGRLRGAADEGPTVKERAILKGPAEMNCVAFSPDGRTLLTASRGGAARFWDMATGKPLGVPLRHPDAVVAAAYAPDGTSVATARARRPFKASALRTPPAPIDGDVERIRLWVETLTGMELDDAGRGPRPDAGGAGTASAAAERAGRAADRGAVRRWRCSGSGPWVMIHPVPIDEDDE